MTVIVFWILLSAGAGMLASRYNRDALGWFILAVLISPVIGFIWLLALGPAAATRAGYQPTTGDQVPDADEVPMSMGEAYRKAQEQHHLRATGRMW